MEVTLVEPERTLTVPVDPEPKFTTAEVGVVVGVLTRVLVLVGVLVTERVAVGVPVQVGVPV
jgi:hypothetical protein